MPTDHPDGTFPVALIMADIMMPVDIQAQYVTLAIDIKTQTLSQVNINIAAQTLGNLNVNIAASAITMNVAVTGTANINITAQSVGIYLQPEWAAKIGIDKNFYAAASGQASGDMHYGSYTVTGGKTLYLNTLSFLIHADSDADRDLPQIGHADLVDYTDYPTVVVLAAIGGNGGGGISFTKPITLAGGRVLRYRVLNYSNHTCTMGVCAFGYEI